MFKVILTLATGLMFGCDLWGTTQPAQALLYEFSGHITEVDFSAPGTGFEAPLAVGDSFIGFVYYSNTPGVADLSQDPDVGVYIPIMSSYGVYFDTFSVQSQASSNYAFIVRNGNAQDSFTLEDNRPGASRVIFPESSYYIDDFFIKFTSTSNPFTDDSFPVDFNPNLFEQQTINFYGYTSSFEQWINFDAYGAIHPASSNPVPEPTTMLLFGAGLTTLAGVARRKRTRQGCKRTWRRVNNNRQM